MRMLTLRDATRPENLTINPLRITHIHPINTNFVRIFFEQCDCMVVGTEAEIALAIEEAINATGTKA